MGFSFAPEGDSRCLSCLPISPAFRPGYAGRTQERAAADRGLHLRRTAGSTRARAVQYTSKFASAAISRAGGRRSSAFRRRTSRSQASRVMPQRAEALATRARDPELREKVLGTAQIKLPAYPSFTERTHIHGYATGLRSSRSLAMIW